MKASQTASSRRSTYPSGQVVFVALVVLLLVGVAASLVAASLALESRHAIDEARRVQLTALADAAVAEALAHLAQDRGFPGRQESSLGGGSYESRTRSLGSDLVEVQVVARTGGWERRVRAVVRVAPTRARVVRWERLAEPQGSQR